MKIAGYPLAQNSIIGFKLQYLYNTVYEPYSGHDNDVKNKSAIYVTLILPNQLLELEEEFPEEKNKEEIKKMYEEFLTTLFIATASNYTLKD